VVLVNDMHSSGRGVLKGKKKDRGLNAKAATEEGNGKKKHRGEKEQGAVSRDI